MDPEILLPGISRLTSGQYPKVSGMEPERLLLATFNCSKLCSVPIDDGIVPLRLLNEKDISTIDLKLHNIV